MKIFQSNFIFLIIAIIVYTVFIYTGYEFFDISVMLTSIPLCGLATWLFNFRIAIKTMLLITLINVVVMMYHLSGLHGWRIAIEPGGVAMQFVAILLVAKIKNNYRKIKDLTQKLEIRIQDRNRELEDIANYIVSESQSERSRMSESLCALAEQQQRELLNRCTELDARLLHHGAQQQSTSSKLVELARENVEQINSLRDRLSSERIMEKGIDSALREVCAHYQRSKEVNFEISLCDELGNLPQDIVVNLYRIAYEGITNALRHGKADFIALSVDRTETHCTLEVTNNGRPLADNPRSGLGTRLIQHRAETMQGTISLDHTCAGMTSLFCKVPLSAGECDYSA